MFDFFIKLSTDNQVDLIPNANLKFYFRYQYTDTLANSEDPDQHISSIATKTLDFLRRNLSFARKSTKEVAHKSLVRHRPEYAVPIWNQYSKTTIQQVEKVQRMAAVGGGATLTVLGTCSTSCSDQLLRPGGISHLHFSSTIMSIDKDM